MITLLLGTAALVAVPVLSLVCGRLVNARRNRAVRALLEEL